MKKIREVIDMYDMILANMIAGTSVIEPSEEPDNKSIAVGFSSVASSTSISKYFLITNLPDWIEKRTLSIIRNKCKVEGVRVDILINAEPYNINWDSTEMQNRMRVWREYDNEVKSSGNTAFDFRDSYAKNMIRQRIVKSTMYLNEADLRYERKMVKAYFIIKLTVKRNDAGRIALEDATKKVKGLKGLLHITTREIRINLLDWLKVVTPFSLISMPEINRQIPKFILTDDLLSNMMSYRQGRIGDAGIPLGVDVLEGGAAMHVFKEHPDMAENWAIVGETGSGKSLLGKSWLPYFTSIGYTTLIIDYEGDEYTNYGNYLRAGNPRDVKVVAFGKNGASYANPCAIAELTGDEETDADLKNQAVQDTTTFFRIMVNGNGKDLTREQKKVVSMAIQKEFELSGVTDDMNTWAMSKEITPIDIYNRIHKMVISKTLVSEYDNNEMHRAALDIDNACSIYFDEKSPMRNAFNKPINIAELHEAKVVIFSFGMRGQSEDTTDPVILALKQLSVSILSTQLANHTKYVKHTFTVKVWEEYQRWIRRQGSSDIITNAITGGRKRGDINIIISNDIKAFCMDDKNSSAIYDNISNYVIGAIPKKTSREDFCEKRDFMDCLDALNKIAKDNKRKGSGSSNGRALPYKHAFCLMLADGTRAIIKASLPSSVLNSKLYKTGVQIE